jgi:hypothetical protein
MGYTLFDDDGKVLWSLDNQLEDHADGVAILRFRPESDPRLLCAASDEGIFFADMQGRVSLHHYIGHPDMCNAVLDVTGDCRDEIVVWDPHDLWVYTQSDSPKPGRLYKPKRNPLYNTSNYQATVSLPGWSE